MEDAYDRPATARPARDCTPATDTLSSTTPSRPVDTFHTEKAMHNDNLPESGPAGGRRKHRHARRSVTTSPHIVRRAPSAGLPAVRRAEPAEREQRRCNR